MFTIYKRAENLPEFWDEIVGDNPFLKQKCLKLLEALNPCNQTYHLNSDKGIALVSYKLNLDLFTFSKYITLKIPITIIGIPMSVSRCSYALVGKDKIDDLCNYVKSLKGFHVILNSTDHLELPRGFTFPSYRLKIHWNTFNEYIQSMRSNYRYRFLKSIKKFSPVKTEILNDNNLFDVELYKLYEAVFNRSKGKLEKLSLDFFKNYPSKIIKFTIAGQAIAFVQLVENDNELIFLLGGFNHSLNKQYDLYINILLYIINYGIDKGFDFIELGQTADETKSKLGSIKQTKLMYVYHSNFIINAIMKILIDKFTPIEYGVSHNVFKGAGDEDPFGKMS